VPADNPLKTPDVFANEMPSTLYRKPASNGAVMVIDPVAFEHVG
jgi:hypothetical protein